MPPLVDLHADPFAGRDPHEAAVPVATTESGDTGKPPIGLRDVQRAIRRRWPVALLVAGLVAVVGAAGVLRKFRPNYRAESTIHIAPVMPRVLHEDGEWHKLSIEGFYNDYVRTLTQVATERSVLAPAIDELEADGVSWLPPSVPLEEAPDHLRSRLQISVVRETHLFRIALDDRDAAVPAPVVNAVTDAFMELVRRENALLDDRKAQALIEDRKRIRTELDHVHAELDSLSERLGSALLDERQNPFVERLHVLDEGMTKIFVRRVQAEGALENARGRAEELLASIPEGEVLAEVEADVAVRDARVQLVRMLREMKAAVVGLSPEHPTAQVWAERRRKAEAELDRLIAEVRARAMNRIGRQRAEEAAELLSAAEREVEAARRSESSMVEVLDGAKIDLQEHGRAMFDGSRLRARASQLLEELRRAEARIEQLRLESQAPARLTLRSPAVQPLRAAKDVRKPLLGGVALGALGLGIAVALFLDRRHPVVFDRDDVEATGADLALPTTGDVTNSRTAAELLLRLEAGSPGSPLRVLSLPVTSSEREDAARLADSLTDTGADAASTLLVTLDRAARDLDDVSGRTVWSPVEGDDQAAALVRTPAFRRELDARAATCGIAAVSAASPSTSAVSWPLVRLGWLPLLVARAESTGRRELLEAVDALRAAGAAQVHVLLLGEAD